ncbi:signaling protein, partial [Nocardioides sp. CER28]
MASSMTQRTLAGLIAVPLVVALLVVAWVSPLPYVVYRPGPTLDVLGKTDGKPIIQVSGHQTYRDGGKLRMTTVSVTRPDTDVRLPELLAAWVSKKDAVYPWDAVYQKGTTDTESRQEGAVQMASSQDVATAIALQQLGVK